MERKPIDERMAEALEAVEKLTAERGYCPTVREVGHAMDVSSSSTAFYILKALEKEGLITMDRMIARSIRVTTKGQT